MFSFLFSLVVAYGGAVAAGLLFATCRKRAGLLAYSVLPALLLCPLLIPPDHVILRAFAAVLPTEAMFKLIDYGRQLRRPGNDTVAFRDFLRFLVPFPILLVVFADKQQRFAEAPPRWREAVRVCSGAAVFATCFMIIHAVADIGAIRSSFALDHTVKLAVFVLAIESLSQALFGLERLAGYDAPPIIRRAFLSRTAAEFWRRYNTRVHAWLWENVFRPSGGRRAPVRGVLLTFFVSGILHEFMFGIATSRFDGYQFTFFMLQAPAVLLSPSLERLARRRTIIGPVVAHSLTVVWFAVTSVFFFHGMNRIFPFIYASQPWLP
jgi:D-alanyl-lipoteichoic acid acyltransferase DltB (MBOAT superfamily)